ncbi:beta-ketoacyl synthase N-terminal-like domain-containing protein [Streptomyces albidoflavus]
MDVRETDPRAADAPELDVREILARYKGGELDRGSASSLLSSLTGREGTGPQRYVLPHAEFRAREASSPEDAGAADAVAVIGMAGRYPGATGLADFWENLREGRDTSAGVPPARPGEPLLAAGQRGHFLDAAGEFDPEFFGIDEAQARLVDPQQRLFLECAWEALEDAGRTGASLDALTGAHGRPRAVGVFAGVASADHTLLGAEAWARGSRAPLGDGPWDTAGRVARLLGLTGPVQAVDTRWSSGLTAVHLAVEALRRGECAAAVAGGVELLLHPSRKRPGAGEGVGALVLRPLRAALAAGDPVHAVLRATSAGSARPVPADGSARIPVGLRETRESTRRRIGDAGAATGIAALTAAVLQLRHGELAPVREGAAARDWQHPRRALVDLAPEPGDGPVAGLGAAALLDAFVPGAHVPPQAAADAPRPAVRAAGPETVLLSAPTPRHLAAAAHQLLTWLDVAGAAADLPALARALRAGRSAQPCRTALVVSDLAGLKERLRALAHGEKGADLREGSGDPLGLGALPETAAYLTALRRGGHLGQLTALWLSGVPVDWAALDAGDGRRPAGPPLPPSGFLRRPLWRDGARPGERDG